MSNSDVIYEDKYCKLTKTQLIIKCYYFPTGQTKQIHLCEIKKIYYANQTMFYKQCGLTKGWGMSVSPIWWACDLRRGLRNSQQLNNVVIDLGNSMLQKGFTVADITKFLDCIRPLLHSSTAIIKEIPF